MKRRRNGVVFVSVAEAYGSGKFYRKMVLITLFLRKINPVGQGFSPSFPVTTTVTPQIKPWID